MGVSGARSGGKIQAERAKRGFCPENLLARPMMVVYLKCGGRLAVCRLLQEKPDEQTPALVGGSVDTRWAFSLHAPWRDVDDSLTLALIEF